MARLSRRFWGGTSLKTAAKEARYSGVGLVYAADVDFGFLNKFLS